MKQIINIKRFLNGLALGAVVLTTSAGTVAAAPAASGSTQTPPASRFVSGAQAKNVIVPGSKDTKSSEPMGPTSIVATDGKSAPKALPENLSGLVGNVSGIDFLSGLNYCYKNLVYTPVYNGTTTGRYVQVRLYNQGGYRDFYTYMTAGSYLYPTFYNTEGAWSAYLYVWNGSSYVYDEYMGGTNTCNVSVTRTYDTGSWVQLKIQNTGTAYATQVSTELAPYPGSGTYTGVQYDYPTPGGAAVYRWFQVGYVPYGIYSYTSGSNLTPVPFKGDQ